MLSARAQVINILGICYDNLTSLEVLHQVQLYIQEGGTQMIRTPNADHVVRTVRAKCGGKNTTKNEN